MRPHPIINPILTATRDTYIDGLILRNGVPLMWQFDGGYISLDANGNITSWNFYITDHLGNNRMVVTRDNIIKETIDYYPYGSEMRMTDPALLASTADKERFRFSGKELDFQNGLNMYDFGARMFDVAGVPVWTSVDPLAEKNCKTTPYSYCNGDPVNRFDPDGREVKPDSNSLDVIKNTLSQEEQDYVRLNDDGLIDATYLSQCSSESNNFTALKTLVNSEIRVNVTMQSEMNYISNGTVMKESFLQVEVCNDFKDVNFTSCIGNTQGETGNLGVTYMPTNGGAGKGPIDGSSIDININPTLSPIGAAETFAHEGYGHANIYVLSNGNRNAAIHHYVGVKETNSTLFNFSIRARKETVKNMTR